MENNEISDKDFLDMIIKSGQEQEALALNVGDNVKVEKGDHLLARLRKANSIGEKEKILQEVGLAKQTGHAFDRPLKTADVVKSLSMAEINAQPLEGFVPNMGDPHRVAIEKMSDERQSAALNRAVAQGQEWGGKFVKGRR